MVLFPKGEQLFPTFLLQKIFENFFRIILKFSKFLGTLSNLFFHIIFKASLLYTATVLKQNGLFSLNPVKIFEKISIEKFQIIFDGFFEFENFQKTWQKCSKSFFDVFGP